MARKCCVPNCEDRTSARLHLPVFNEKMFEICLDRIGDDKLKSMNPKTLYDRWRICIRHFSDHCKIPGETRAWKLKAGSLPTLFLPNFSEEPTEKNSIFDFTAERNSERWKPKVIKMRKRFRVSGEEIQKIEEPPVKIGKRPEGMTMAKELVDLKSNVMRSKTDMLTFNANTNGKEYIKTMLIPKKCKTVSQLAKLKNPILKKAGDDLVLATPFESKDEKKTIMPVRTVVVYDSEEQVWNKNYEALKKIKKKKPKKKRVHKVQHCDCAKGVLMQKIDAWKTELKRPRVETIEQIMKRKSQLPLTIECPDFWTRPLDSPAPSISKTNITGKNSLDTSIDSKSECSIYKNCDPGTKKDIETILSVVFDKNKQLPEKENIEAIESASEHDEIESVSELSLGKSIEVGNKSPVRDVDENSLDSSYATSENDLNKDIDKEQETAVNTLLSLFFEKPSNSVETRTETVELDVPEPIITEPEEIEILDIARKEPESPAIIEENSLDSTIYSVQSPARNDEQENAVEEILSVLFDEKQTHLKPSTSQDLPRPEFKTSTYQSHNIPMPSLVPISNHAESVFKNSNTNQPMMVYMPRDAVYTPTFNPGISHFQNLLITNPYRNASQLVVNVQPGNPLYLKFSVF